MPLPSRIKQRRRVALQVPSRHIAASKTIERRVEITKADIKPQVSAPVANPVLIAPHNRGSATSWVVEYGFGRQAGSEKLCKDGKFHR